MIIGYDRHSEGIVTLVLMVKSDGYMMQCMRFNHEYYRFYQLAMDVESTLFPICLGVV